MIIYITEMSCGDYELVRIIGVFSSTENAVKACNNDYAGYWDNKPLDSLKWEACRDHIRARSITTGAIYTIYPVEVDKAVAQ